MALSKKENEDTIIKIVKNWSEEIPTKTPKKEQIIKYFNEIDEIKEETLNNINKYLVKHIINVLNEEYQEGQVKSIKDYKLYIKRVIQTCNHFMYKKDKIINEDEEIKLKEKLEKAMKKDNTIRLKNLLNERSEENIIEKSIQRINEIESKKQYVEFMKEKKRKQKITKRINQSYLIEEGIKHINTRNKEFPNLE